MPLEVTYRIEKNHQGFDVYQATPRQVNVMSSVPDGGLQFAAVPYTSVFKGYDPPILKVWYRGEGRWHTDVDRGAMRFEKERTVHAVRAALKRLGFSADEIHEAIKHAKS